MGTEVVAPPSDGADDGSVEAALSRGDHREALRRCAELHGDAVGRLCMAFTGAQGEAEELTQDVLLTAHDSFASYRAEGTFRSWLFTIARRVAARHLETRGRREARLRLVHDASRPPEADELTIEKERAEKTRAALAGLKPTEREAILLRYEAGLPFREVAAACGVDEATARKRVSRALVRLRAALAEEA